MRPECSTVLEGEKPRSSDSSSDATSGSEILCTWSKDGRQYDLVLVVDSGEWRAKDALHALQEKINSYASYALDGAMAADYPDSAGRSKTIF